MRVIRGAGYGWFKFSGYIFLSCADHGTDILGTGEAVYWPLSRGGRRREASTRANVTVCMERRPGRKIVAVVERCRCRARCRGSTVYRYMY